MIEKLLALHNEPLGVKNIWTKQELVKIIRIDFEKINYALFELKTKSIPQLLNDFFSETQEFVPDLLAEIRGTYLYHIGFEVNEPLELILYGIKRRINQLKLDAQIKIIRVLIFPASEAFQHRVNAYAEIMRLWLQVDNREFMLELFDIHRPVDRSLPSSQFELKMKDTIWHYAIYLDSQDKVRYLHDRFKKLIEKSNIYKLPFESAINNKYDGSFLTKIINKNKQVELEFVNAPFATGPIPSPTFLQLK